MSNYSFFITKDYYGNYIVNMSNGYISDSVPWLWEAKRIGKRLLKQLEADRRYNYTDPVVYRSD